MHNHRSSPLGFTIVEILLALAILTTVVLAIYEQFPQVGRMGLDRVTGIQANLLAQEELERLRACPYESLTAWQPPPTPQAHSTNLKFSCQDKVVPRPDGVLELIVQVGVTPAGEATPQSSAWVIATVKGIKAP